MSNSMSLSEELESIRELHDNGTLTHAEFEDAKRLVMKKHQEGPSPTMTASSSVSDFKVEPELLMGMPVNSFCMVLHFSQFMGFVIPFAGFLGPLFLWIYAKDQSPDADAHGKEVLNWIITLTIYTVISVILCLVLIGFVLLVVLAIAGFVYPIMGALAANEGREFKYPSIKFLR